MSPFHGPAVPFLGIFGNVLRIGIGNFALRDGGGSSIIVKEQ